MTKFDIKAWTNATVVPPTPPDDLSAVRQIANDALAATGIDGQVMNVDQMVSHWEAIEKQQMDLIDAELGDESVVRITRADGQTDFYGLSENHYVFDAYKKLVIERTVAGDNDSVNQLLSIFPDFSQLLSGIQSDISNVVPAAEPSAANPITEVTRGTRDDLIPGIVDYRSFVSAEDKKLDSAALAQAALDKLKNLSEINTEDWIELSNTYKNVEKKFGEEVKNQAWDILQIKFNQWQDSER